MGETLDIIREKFKPYRVPELLADLCNYRDTNPEFFSGSFEVDHDESDSVKDWFQNSEEGYSRVRIFGIDGIQSLYGFWITEGTEIDDAPVVYLGGEGEGTTVLAGNMKDFLSILAANRDYECFDGDFCDVEEGNEEENSKFRKWLKEDHGISPAKDPMEIVKSARKKCPEFNEWLKKIIPGWE